MKINKLINTICIFLLLLTVTKKQSVAQTYVEPRIGYGTAKYFGFPTETFHSNRVLDDEKYTNGQIMLGLGLTQRIVENLYLSIYVDKYFEDQLVRYRDVGFVGYTNVRFNRHSFSIAPYYQIRGKFEVGVGAEVAALNEFMMGKPRLDFWADLPHQYDSRQLGWLVSIGYTYNSIIASLEYTKLKAFEVERHDLISGMNTIELTIKYRFKVLEKPRLVRSKVDCPKIGKRN